MTLFLSYSHKDKEFALKLFNTLTRSGISVFMDDKDIKVGDNILDRIEQGIEETSGLLYIISANSIQSKWVKEELGMARVKALTREGKYAIYPILIDDVDLSLGIGQLKYADFIHWEISEKYYSAVMDLLNSLGINLPKMEAGLIDFSIENSALIDSVALNSKALVGLIEGAVDYFYYVRGILHEYSINYMSIDEIDRERIQDVARRIYKMSMNLTLNIPILLPELFEKLSSQTFNSRQAIMDTILVCARDYESLFSLDDVDKVLNVSRHFQELADELNNLLLNSFQEMAATIRKA